MRRFRFVLPLGLLGLVTASIVSSLSVSMADAASPAYTVQTLHFAVRTGPTEAQACDIVGDLYTPSAATSKRRVPAILTTNGFGGSKDDQAGLGKAFASRGYAVLSYSGLGFGGSGCKITLDDPDFDGRAASQLVSYLGGAAGIAFTDAAHTKPAPRLGIVIRDSIDHAKRRNAFDPRVGMIGGSYGGQIQFAAASVDPRIDTIVPLITWNDLSYSLDPNNTDQSRGVSTRTPGAIKLNWGLGFSAKGVADGLQNAQGDPSRLYPCPNFADFVCPALVTAGTTGYFATGDVAKLRHASVANYMKKIKVPVLLIQGENDTLFNLNEAAATYQALKAQGTPVKMIWQSWGHSGSAPAPGEISLDNPNQATQYETARISNWFEHYLKKRATNTGPNFSYFRDWVRYSGIATPAYASSSSFPVGTKRTMYLSGGGQLVNSASQLRVGSQNFVTPPAGAPTSVDPLDVVGSFSTSLQDQPEIDAPGTNASWQTPALASALRVAGSPTLNFRVLAPTAAATQTAGPGGQLVLFAKLADIAPDGTAKLIKGFVAPIRIPDVTRPVRITLPGIVHQFAPSHRIGLVVAGGSANYRGGLTAVPVTIAVGDPGQTLVLPVVR